jgi:hypothetical protein
LRSIRSFLCFLISRWLPSTSGLSWSWRHNFRVDSFRSLATVYIKWRLEILYHTTVVCWTSKTYEYLLLSLV